MTTKKKNPQLTTSKQVMQEMALHKIPMNDFHMISTADMV